MFANALKSISATNITANYSISSTPSSTAGAWKIYDCKKKSTGKPYSVFVFDRKSLDGSSSGAFGSSSRSGATNSAMLKRAAEEVVERLRKEASSLARLRHPNILELVEPVEDTRGGGLQFVTEPVVASLSGLLQEKDDVERRGGSGAGRTSRYTTEDTDGGRKRKELELDDLEIQKGVLQISKALEFLHENAGLVHGNLTPDAVLVNAKSDWKISGLAFCSPAANSDKPTSFQPISLSEVLNLDPRLPRFVQLDLDYTSPDFVMDNNVTSAADMFSLGILCVTLYNSPHKSPLEAHGGLSSYKRLFSSPGSIPTVSNNFLSSKPVPKELASLVLPRLITRRPAQRLTAREFQASEYFDNVLVSTIRFLDSFPTKTAAEKSSFLRGLQKVLPSFPKTVMERKILPALLDETKDRELLSLILHNVFKIVELLPAGIARRVFADRVRPALKHVFIANAKQGGEKDPIRDAGLMMVLEHMPAISANCNGKEFKDDILPVYMLAIESPAPTLVDMSLRTLAAILPVLDFSTIKNELFPVIATMFSRTSSLAIKVRGLQAFVVLCGGSNDTSTQSNDGLDGFNVKKTASSSALDKYTMQEKIIPLVKAIKTKEPAVMIASLKLLQVIGEVADGEFVAMEILPILWSMSLGPLLNLKQFQAFMDLIKLLSRRVEDEQIKKLQELSGTSDPATAQPGDDFMSFGGITGTQFDASPSTEDDFERLVKGRAAASSAAGSAAASGWDDNPPLPVRSHSHTQMAPPTTSSATKSQASPPPSFSWSTPPPSQSTIKPQPPTDLNRFGALSPSVTQFSQPLQPAPSNGSGAASTSSFSMASTPAPAIASGGIDWSAAAKPTPSPWGSSSMQPLSGLGGASMNSLASLGQKQQQNSSAWPATSTSSGAFGMTQAKSPSSAFSLPPPPAQNVWASSSPVSQQQQQQQKPTGGLDKYQSLL
ncbi:Protein kinase-like protein SCY1 [Ceratocystis fimbriata CBS 114723]|uniref:Protein kinase-like protein SCY1 n=1 Tax=Ceratocystis fimbriata CBS 114723 TaxID=1035309 RepID=A0A2C5X3P8_9PEZI|nr:Protein kinase-like protein SCY1 [Ceratocystis fimbriata CBS 114723]